MFERGCPVDNVNERGMGSGAGWGADTVPRADLRKIFIFSQGENHKILDGI